MRLRQKIALDQYMAFVEKNDVRQKDWSDLHSCLGQNMWWQSNAYQRLLRNNPRLLESVLWDN